MSEKTEEEERERVIRDMLEAQIDEAWDWMLRDPRGKLVLWSMLDKCGLFSFPHYGNSMDALMRGRQQVAAETLADYVFPRGMKVYTDMLLEAEHRQKLLEQAMVETDAAINEENET